MNRKLKILAAFGAMLLTAYFIPLATPHFGFGTSPVNAKVTSVIIEVFVVLQWYARNHTLACIVQPCSSRGLIRGVGE